MIHIKSKLCNVFLMYVVKNECKEYFWCTKQLVFVSFEKDVLTNVYIKCISIRHTLQKSISNCFHAKAKIYKFIK